MLTKNELTWLEKRGKHPYCQIWCMFDHNSDDCEWEQAAEYCPLVHGRKALIEAGQFEERVTIKLTRMPNHYPEGPCDFGNSGQCSIECDNIWLDCREARLKWARLQVEEEMDNG